MLDDKEFILEYEEYLANKEIENAEESEKFQLMDVKAVVGERELVGVGVTDLEVVEVVKVKKVKANKTKKVSKSNRWNITLTEDEIDLLAKIVFRECGGEVTENSQEAVIEVIFNRMIFEYEFSGTLTEVLSSKNQFTTWENRNSSNPNKDIYAAIYKVLEGKSNVLGLDVVYFSTSPRNSKSYKIGNHYFCRYIKPD